MEQFINLMHEVLDTERSINLDTRLNEIEEWNSLSYVVFLAMVDAQYGKTADPKAVKAASTVGELYAIIGEL